MVQLDRQGIIQACPQCGQRNRVPFAQIEHSIRCGKCKGPIPPLDSPVEIRGDQEFAALISGSPLPVLTDFWAPWCGPCKMVAPELEKVATSEAGSSVVAKVNTDALPSLAQQFGISSIPTLILFQHGREFSRMAGARPAAAISAFIAQATATA